jgi:hypothetical protein
VYSDWAMGWTILPSIPGGSKRVTSRTVQTGSEGHQDSYSEVRRVFFAWDKAAKGVKLTTHLHFVPGEE